MHFDDRLGCEACLRGSPEQAWSALAALRVVDELVDEPHYRVRLLECPVCGDRCASVFAESVDWQDGDDAQEWLVLPLSRDEAEYLIGQQPEQVGPILETIGRSRRFLDVDHPTGRARTLRWVAGGLHIPLHD
jgi:hypothetical protein